MPLQLPSTTDNPNAESLLTPDEFRALVAHLHRKTEIAYTVHRVVNAIGLMGGTVGLLWIKWRGTDDFVPYLLPAVCVLGLTAIFGLGILYDNTKIASRLQTFVENTQDARQVGTILDLFLALVHSGGKWPELHNAVNNSITRLLAMLQPEDTDALNTQQRALLRRRLFLPGFVSLLGYKRIPDSCLSVLSALIQIGDKRDLPDVERLLKDFNLTDDIRTAVEHCAQTIRERVAREEGKDFLLRADRRPETVETLLRPSTENADTPPQQLLRAAMSDDGNTTP